MNTNWDEIEAFVIFEHDSGLLKSNIATTRELLSAATSWEVDLQYLPDLSVYYKKRLIQYELLILTTINRILNEMNLLVCRLNVQRRPSVPEHNGYLMWGGLQVG